MSNIRKSESEKFKLANDIEFYGACLDFMDGIDPERKNHLSRVGDRIRLITDLENNGFAINRIEGFKKIEQETTEVNVSTKATVEVVNHDKKKSWVRWYMPDFSDNGNIDLPEGNYKIKTRIGRKITLEKI